MGKKILFMLLNCLIIGSYVQAQVGVNTEKPNKLTEFEVTNLKDEVADTIIPKGIMIPRLTEKQRDVIDVSDPTSNSLMIYNTDEDCYNYYSKTENEWQSLCGKLGKAKFTVDCGSIEVFGIYGDKVALNTSNYIKLSIDVEKMGSYSISAVADPDNGYFYETTGTFYSTGTFTITIPGTGQPVNHTQGSDLVSTDDDTPDEFTLTSNGGGGDCNFEVNVRSTAARPEFEIDCAATVVEGMYFEDQVLSSVPNPINQQSHRIKVTLKNIPSTSFGAVASLETNTVDGISFKGEAVLTSSTQVIYLTGTGTPRGLSDKIMIITSNSETSNASCQATVNMLIPKKRLLAIGDDNDTYGYNLAWKTNRVVAINPPTYYSGFTSGNDLLTDKDNFGYNSSSIVKFAGFDNKEGAGNFTNRVTTPNTWTDDNRDIIGLNNLGWNGLTGARLERLLKGTDGFPKIDIVMIGYSTDWFRNNNQADSDKADVLIEFVKTGGILMIFSEHTVSNGNFMNRFFGVSNITSVENATTNPLGSLYTLGFNPDNTPANMKPYYCKDNDPILTGPFDDIVGRVWGEDSSTTRYLVNLPLDEIIIYSGARPIGGSTTPPADGVTVFRHRDYPLVFVGDGGFNSNEVRGYTGLTACPFRLGTKVINGKTYSHYPVLRPHFGTSESNSSSVCNSIFTANAFAWCIMKAEEYRRNNK